MNVGGEGERERPGGFTRHEFADRSNFGRCGTNRIQQSLSLEEIEQQHEESGGSIKLIRTASGLAQKRTLGLKFMINLNEEMRENDTTQSGDLQRPRNATLTKEHGSAKLECGSRNLRGVGQTSFVST